MKKIYFIILPVLFLFIISCEDILDRKPLDQISDADVWNDPGLIEAYMYQAYANAPFHMSLNQDDVTALTSILPVTIADEGFSKKSHEMSRKKWKRNLLDVEGNMFEYWGYQDVRRMNEFLELIDESELKEKEVFAAEMRFLRAFTYFEMAKRYGGVPLITYVQDVRADSSELFVPRNTEKEIYDFIYSELNEVTNILPEVNPGGYGRATKFAAAALNSRAMMYAASVAEWGTVQLDGILGIPQSEAAGYWEKCYDASKIILGEDLKGGVHKLYTANPDPVLNFQEIFLKEKNEEIIFAKQYAGLDILAHNWDVFNTPFNRPPDDGIGGVFFGEPKQTTSVSVYLEMAEEFEYIDGTSGELFNTRDAAAIEANTYTMEQLFADKEPRFHASVYYHSAVWRDVSLDWKKWDVINGVKKQALNLPAKNQQEQTGFGIRKYVSDSRTILPEWADSDVDYIVFRFGEILLNFAEAAYELGLTTDATNAINELRSRVGLPLHSTVDRDLIRHERKVELAFEGNRFWDLRRWRTAVEEILKTWYGIEYGQIDGTDQYKIYLVGGKGAGYYEGEISEKYYYLPITPNRISNNPNLAPENPGY